MSTPVEIDTKLAELYGRRQPLVMRRAQLFARAEKVRPRDPTYADHLVSEAGALYNQVEDIEIEMAPLEAEFSRRGGWTRAFVVPEGHVHRSMSCSTCYPTTEFGWVTELSGATEDEIIEAAGSRACTVCYPNAPVDAPAGRILHETERAAEEARQKRAAKKAEADAKKVANAVGPYRTSNRDNIDTVYRAKQYLTDGYDWGWTHPSYSVEDRDAVAALLAEKFGTTPQEQLDAAAKRAANR